MRRPAKLLWPDTVASRAILILVAALLAFHLLGYWAYRVSVENLATLGQDRGLAERIVSIKRVIAGLPEAPDRDRVAHDLSSASLEVHWSKVSLVLGSAPGTERTRTMEARLETLAPELAAESFRVGFADDGALAAGEADAYRHMMLVSVRLDDGSWVNFSSSALGVNQHADWSVIAATICFGVGIVVVALLLLRWATRPLKDLALAAERFSLDQAPQPLSEGGPAEVRRAARAFNTMRERIQRLVAERMQVSRFLLMARRTGDETRALLLRVGMQMLLERGVSAGVQHIRLQEVLRRAGLTTGAAYRLWADQNDYQRDLAVSMVRLRLRTSPTAYAREAVEKLVAEGADGDDEREHEAEAGEQGEHGMTIRAAELQHQRTFLKPD